MTPEPSLFATAARYCLILAGVLGFMTIVLWVRQIKWRFAFFGYTAFTLVLAAGLINLLRTDGGNTSQLLMRWRVGLQFVAIVLIVASAWLAKSFGG